LSSASPRFALRSYRRSADTAATEKVHRTVAWIFTPGGNPSDAGTAIARAGVEAGWTVAIQHVERDWRADVLAVRASQRVAFEVQWSRQTLAQTLGRQARYRRVGVRGCWFCRYPPSELRRDGGGALAARQDLPLFALVAERGQGGESWPRHWQHGIPAA